MHRAGKILFVAVCMLLGMALAGGTAYAQSATILGLYPAAEVPIGAKVTFTVGTSGFTNPTFYLTDSFGGGATSVNIDNAGDFSWTPNIDEVGTHNLTITVSDQAGDSASASQTITVDGVASISIASPTPGSTVSIGVPLSFLVSSSGLLNPAYTVADSFSYSSVQSADLSASGAFNWTPVVQDIGAHTITVTAKDAYGNTATASTVITVLPTPTLTVTGLTSGMSVDIGQPLSFTATSTGFVSPTYALSDAFAGIGTSTITIGASSGKGSWTPQYNDIGGHPITITASDGTGRSESETVVITVLQQTYAVAQTVIPATSTAPAQPATPVVPTSPPVNESQTATIKTNTTQTTQTTKPSVAQTQTTPPVVTVSDPATASTTSSNTIGVEVTIPTTTPVESLGGFFLNGIVNFFASIVKFL